MYPLRHDGQPDQRAHSDTLSQLTRTFPPHPTMTAAEFRTALEALGLNQTQAAKKMHVPRLKVWRWANGITRIDGEVEALIKCWKRYRKHPKQDAATTQPSDASDQ